MCTIKHEALADLDLRHEVLLELAILDLVHSLLAVTKPMSAREATKFVSDLTAALQRREH